MIDNEDSQDFLTHEEEKPKRKSMNIAVNIGWTLTSRLGRQGLQILTTFILASLITPSDFGLIGMTAIFLNLAALFQNMGTTAAVIQMKETNDSLLSSLYWLNVFFGFLLLGLFYLGAHPIARFYAEPRLPTIIYLLAWTFPLSGISAVQGSLMERDLVFKRISLIEITGTALSSVIGISCALLKMGALSLVFQSLTQNLFFTGFLVFFSHWKPKFHFRLSELKKVYKFSMNLMGFHVINYISRNGDNFLVGKFLGASALGWYAFAYNLMLIPLLNVTASISRVLFPVLSKVQDDEHSFREIYLRVVKHVAFFAFPTVMGIIVISKPFFTYFLGPHWLPALPVVYILTPLGFLQSILSLNGSIYSAKGRTDLLFQTNLIFVSIIISSFVIGLHWGFIGVAWAYAISATLVAYPNLKIPYKLIQLKPIEALRVLSPSFWCTLVMGGCVFLINNSLSWPAYKWFKLPLLIVGGIAFYSLFTWMWNRQEVMDLYGLLKNIKKIKTNPGT